MRKILIVEDDPLFCELLARRLSTEFEVVTASCAKEFLEKAVSEKADLIIMDIMLGDAQGPQLLDELHRKEFNPNTPVIFLSTLVEDPRIPKVTPGRKTALVSKCVPLSGICQVVKKFLDD